MVELLERHRKAVQALCRQVGARRLDVLGSAARGDFDPARSDPFLRRRIAAERQPVLCTLTEAAA